MSRESNNKRQRQSRTKPPLLVSKIGGGNITRLDAAVLAFKVATEAGVKRPSIRETARFFGVGSSSLSETLKKQRVEVVRGDSREALVNQVEEIQALQPPPAGTRKSTRATPSRLVAAMSQPVGLSLVQLASQGVHSESELLDAARAAEGENLGDSAISWQLEKVNELVHATQQRADALKANFDKYLLDLDKHVSPDTLAQFAATTAAGTRTLSVLRSTNCLAVVDHMHPDLRRSVAEFLFLSRGGGDSGGGSVVEEPMPSDHDNEEIHDGEHVDEDTSAALPANVQTLLQQRRMLMHLFVNGMVLHAATGQGTPPDIQELRETLRKIDEVVAELIELYREHQDSPGLAPQPQQQARMLHFLRSRL
eukprot:INCI3713.2.p1 GENE.INCI3713.2~~INCI3713.2.p1  ORF type:complete len:366 (-),score=71.94 INCI3713.2:130-1227(-)